MLKYVSPYISPHSSYQIKNLFSFYLHSKMKNLTISQLRPTSKTMQFRSQLEHHKKSVTAWVHLWRTSNYYQLPLIELLSNMRPFLYLYRVTTTTNIPSFKKQVSATTRRFSDFLGLHEKLTSKHLRTGRIIPPPPEKHIIGTTKVKMSGKEKDEMSQNNDFLEHRRAALERYLNRTAQHPLLRQDPDFMTFLESDEELPKAVSTATLSGAGVMRLFNKVGETVNKITYRMDESDPVSLKKSKALL